MIEINLRSFLSEFNGSKFVVYSSLLGFFVLLSLKLDGVLSLNYFFVFSPLFFCELLVFLGFLIGLISFIICPPSRLDIACRNDFFMMCFCTLEHILLFMFELLCCNKLNNISGAGGEPISWLLVFSPIFVQSFMAMIISVWCIRHDKSFEFEMFFSINVVQFVFIAFKLDRALHWNWVIVFVPAWAMFAMFFVGTFYSLIISIFLSRSVHHFHTHRRSHIFSAICHFLLSIPLLTFFILLSSKLDAFDYWFRYHFAASRMPYVVVGMPLFVALFFLVFLSFGSKSGNTWWFAMRKPFCNFVFEAFPCLQQYANISYKFGYSHESSNSTTSRENSNAETIRMLRPISASEDTPIVLQGCPPRTLHKTPTFIGYSIETPD